MVARLALGTHKSTPEKAGDTLRQSVTLGIPLIDTAPNYGKGTAHAAVREALTAAPGRTLVSTKVGYSAGMFELRRAVDAGLLSPDDIVDSHALSGPYVRARAIRNRTELGVACIDWLFIHNPEHQLRRVSVARLRRILAECFCECEGLCDTGVVRAYGISTWHGLFDVIGVAELVSLAGSVGGAGHHFEALQLPLSLVRSEEIARAIAGTAGVLLDSRAFGLKVFASAPLHGGTLPAMMGVSLGKRINANLSPAQSALLFVRSLPWVEYVLCGCTTLDHLTEILHVDTQEPLEISSIKSLIGLLA